MDLRMGRNGLPECPWDIREVVELYARESGRTATVHFVPTVGWLARFTLKADDIRMRLYQEGRVKEPPPEDVYFHEPEPREGQIIPGTNGLRFGPYRPLDILQMGATGVREFLDRGNLNSGRGAMGTKSLEEMVKEAHEKNVRDTREFREKQRELNRYQVRDGRREKLKLPVVSPGVDLKGSTEPAAAPMAPSST